MKSKIGRLFIILGITMFITGLIYGINIFLDDYVAGEKSEQALEIIEDNEKPNVSLINIDGLDYIGYVKIPKLDLELPILDKWDMKNIHTAPCRYSGSLEENNLVLASHDYRKHFYYIKDLNVGDEVTFIKVNGEKIEYQVSDVMIVYPFEVEKIENEEPDLIIFTCYMDGRYRTIVYCKRKTA